MLKKIKAFVEPLGRLLTTHGIKGPPKSTSTTCNFYSTKQYTDLQKQIAESNFSPIINVQENSKLCSFLGLFNNKFNYFSKPTPIVTWNSNQLHIQNKICLLHNPAFLRPIGLKNVFVTSNTRKFSTNHATSMANNTTNCSGNVTSCLGFKPFSNLFNKPDSLFSKYYLNNLDQKIKIDNANDLKENKFKFHEKSIGHNLFDQSNKDTLKIDKKKKMKTKTSNNNKIAQNINIMTVCDNNTFDDYYVINESLKKKENEDYDEIFDNSMNYNATKNIQCYLVFVVNSPLLWAHDDIITSISNINCVTSGAFLLHKKSPDIQELNHLIIKRLHENSELYYIHMKEIMSILEKLSQHGNYEIKIFEYELRVNFPRGMQIEEIENLLVDLGIGLENPHFELEMINFEDSIFISPKILNDNLNQSYNINDDMGEEQQQQQYSINFQSNTIHEEKSETVDKNNIQNFIASIDKLNEMKLDFFKYNDVVGNPDIGESYNEF